jgi:hypothetical protein
MKKGYTDRRIYSFISVPFFRYIEIQIMKGSIIMNKELNNAIKNNEKVYEDNKKATDKSIKSIQDVMATMDKIEKNMVWNKLCDCEKKLDKILEMLGDK